MPIAVRLTVALLLTTACSSSDAAVCVSNGKEYAEGEQRYNGCVSHSCDAQGYFGGPEKACPVAFNDDDIAAGRLCYPLCAVEPDVEVLGELMNCGVVAEWPTPDGPVEGVVRPCDLEDDEWVLPVDTDVCFSVHVDRSGATPSSADDMTSDCAATGLSVEVQLHVAVQSPPDVVYRASCELSEGEALRELECLRE